MQNGTAKPANPQPDLPGLVGSDGAEQLDIAGSELAELERRLASEGRCITVLTVRRPGGYTATIQKRRHNGIQSATAGLP